MRDNAAGEGKKGLLRCNRLARPSAMRLIRQSPGFVACTVLTLALGIGANTAISAFSRRLCSAVFRFGGRTLSVEVAAIDRNGGKVPFSFSLFQQLEENQRAFSSLFGWTGGFGYNLEVDGVLFPGSVRGVTGN